MTAPVEEGLISIIMPMRNAEDFVRAALDSLLGQTGAKFEIIVVDDGSTDRSAQVVRGLGDARIRLIPGPQTGISAALNAGLTAARGAYFARCDADDLYPPDRLGWQHRILETQPDLDAVCGYFSQVTNAGRHIVDRKWGNEPEEISEELRNGVGRTHLCAFLIRMDLMRRLNGFRTWFITAEDADFQFRLGELGRVWYEPRPAYLYRLHDSSITHTQNTEQRRFFERCAAQFQAQRRVGGMDDLMRGQPPEVPLGSTSAARPARDQIQHLLLSAAWREHASGQRLRSVGTGFRACFAQPTAFSAWRSLAALMIKPAGNGKAGGSCA